VRETKKINVGNLFSQKETKRKKRKKEKLFYVFTTMTSLSAVDNLECNNAGNKSVQNCKKMKMLFFISPFSRKKTFLIDPDQKYGNNSC
jgi:hypothetical protein